MKSSRVSVKSLGREVTALNKKLGMAGTATGTFIQQQGKYIKSTRLSANATGGLNKQVSLTANTLARFRMEMLGVLFFGMFLQRTFNTLISSTTSFFQEVTRGATATGQALTRLGAY